jgi:hypothetical protein
MPNTFDVTESFSHVSTLAQLLTKAKAPAGVLNLGGSVGSSFALGTASQGYRANNNGIGYIIPQGPSRKFYFKLRFSSVGQNFFYTTDNGTIQNIISLDGSGHIVVKRNSTVLATSSSTFTINTIYNIAIELTIDNTAGVFNVFVNGVSAVAFSSGDTQNTANASMDAFYILCTGGNYDYSDLIAYPFSQTTIMTCNVNPFKVNSNGARVGFSRGGTDLGSNAAQVSKALASNTSFNFSSVLNTRDNFAMDAVPSGTVLGARLYAWAQNDGSSLRSVALTVEQGASDDVGANISLPAGIYAFYGRDASVDPATAANWASLSALNSAKMGYKITV